MSIAPRTPRAGLMAGSALIRSEPADFRVDWSAASSGATNAGSSCAFMLAMAASVRRSR